MEEIKMTIDNIYSGIADNTMSAIDRNWDKAELTVKRAAKDAINFKGGITLNNEFSSFKFKLFDRRQLVKDFHRLYDIMTEQDSNHWNKAIFILFPSGKFNLTFNWDEEMAAEFKSLSKE